jgi:hypothetical protein
MIFVVYVNEKVAGAFLLAFVSVKLHVIFWYAVNFFKKAFEVEQKIMTKCY